MGTRDGYKTSGVCLGLLKLEKCPIASVRIETEADVLGTLRVEKVDGPQENPLRRLTRRREQAARDLARHAAMPRLELLEVLTVIHFAEAECYVDKRASYMTGRNNGTRYSWYATYTSLIPPLQDHGIEIPLTGAALLASNGAADALLSLDKLPHESHLHLPVWLR